MKITIKQLTLLSFGGFILFTGLFQAVDLGFLVNLIIWYYSCVYCMFDIKRRLGYACFLATFFLFLLGAYVADQFFHYSENVVLFDKEITAHMYLAIGIALIGLFAGNIFQSHIRSRKANLYYIDNKHYITAMRSVSRIGFYLSYIPYLISEVLQVSFVRNAGYTELYLNGAISLPFLFRLVAYSCPVFLFMYLSTLPSKKECGLSIFFYIFYSAVSLLTGQRSIFVINCMTVFMYYMYRDSLDIKERWIGKKTMVSLAIILPVTAILLNVYGQVRFGSTDIKIDSFYHSILDVFTSQGVSISVIGYGKYYENSLPDKLYSLSGIIEFFKYNPISDAIFNYTGYTGQTAERALNGDLFTHAISYLVLPYNYVRGRGLGSSYIAEVYHDFSYVGVFLISFIYGAVLKICSNFNRNSVWLRFTCLMTMNTLLMAPRSTTDSFITNFTNIQVIFAVSIVWGTSNILYNKEKIGLEKMNVQ